MTETQRAVIEKLMVDSMTSKELAADLHINHSTLNNIMRAMVRNGWLSFCEDHYFLAKDYNPPLSWNFKPLMKVWK